MSGASSWESMLEIPTQAASQPASILQVTQQPLASGVPTLPTSDPASAAAAAARPTAARRRPPAQADALLKCAYTQPEIDVLWDAIERWTGPGLPQIRDFEVILAEAPPGSFHPSRSAVSLYSYYRRKKSGGSGGGGGAGAGAGAGRNAKGGGGGAEGGARPVASTRGQGSARSHHRARGSA